MTFNFTPFSDSIYVCHLSGTVAYFLDHLHIPRSEVKIEEINRQETEGRARRASSEDCNSLRFITHSLYVTQSKGEGKKLLSHDTRNKKAQLPLYISKHLLTMHKVKYPVAWSFIGSTLVLILFTTERGRQKKEETFAKG